MKTLTTMLPAGSLKANLSKPTLNAAWKTKKTITAAQSTSGSRADKEQTMADRLQFPTAELLKFSRKKEGGTAQFSSSITKAVMQTMEWTEIPDCATGCTLDGELAASVLQLVPKDEALRRNACDL